jgi:hypothetical protein
MLSGGPGAGREGGAFSMFERKGASQECDACSGTGDDGLEGVRRCGRSLENISRSSMSRHVAGLWEWPSGYSS